MFHVLLLVRVTWGMEVDAQSDHDRSDGREYAEIRQGISPPAPCRTGEYNFSLGTRNAVVVNPI